MSSYTNRSSRSSVIVTWLVGSYCLLVLALQIHVTLILHAPLRFSFSDIISLFIIPTYLAYFYHQKNISLKILLKQHKFSMWFIILTLWLGFSLWWGYYNTGILQSWSIFNKFFGWFLLVNYFFMGFWGGKHLSYSLPTILKSLFITNWLVAGYFIIGAAIANNFGYPLPGIVVDRFTGFLQNPSAYGLFCCTVILLQLPYMHHKMLFSESIHRLGLMLGLVSILYSGSRTAMLALLVGIIFLCTRVKFRKKDYGSCILYAVAVALILSFNLFEATAVRKYGYIYKTPISVGRDDSSQHRITLGVSALKLWLQNPILGNGLGSFLQIQNNTYEKLANYELFYSPINPLEMEKPPTEGNAIVLYKCATNYSKAFFVHAGKWEQDLEGGKKMGLCRISVPSQLNGIMKEDNLTNEMRKFMLDVLDSPMSIHNTALWLLAEMGLIGFMLFFSFGVHILKKIYTASNRNDNLIVGGTAILIAFTAASLTTEVMYQRHLWFIMGLMLASLQHERKTLNAPDTTATNLVYS